MSVDAPRLQLRTLGTLDLREYGVPVQSVLAQPKRTALLVYLLLARPRGMHRRDTVIDLLWGEREQERARKALRQALYYLRTALGDDVIIGIGDGEVGAAPESIWCDVIELDRALEDGRIEDALALYRGELLPGFHVDDAPDFERWLDGERESLRRRLVAAGWTAVSRLRQDGQLAPATALAARIVALSPVDEAGVRRLMQLHLAAAEPALALRAYQDLSARLRLEYELEPSPETQSLAASLARARTDQATLPGGRTAGAPDAADAAAPDTVAIATANDRDGAVYVDTVARARSRRRRSVVLLAALGLLVGGGLFVALSGDDVTLDPGLLAVLPFDVAVGDTSLARLAGGLPLMVAQRLDGESGPRTVDVATVQAALQRHGRATGRARVARVVAREVGAARALSGSVGWSGGRLALTAVLTDVTSGQERARAAIEGTADGSDRVVDDLLAVLWSRAAGEPEQRLPHLRKAPLRSLFRYLEGQSLLRQGRPSHALDRFVEAVATDSTFATAALAASIAAGAGGSDWVGRGAELAWRWRDRLSARDLSIVLAKLGPRYPEPSPRAERLAAWESLVPTVGDDPYAYEILYGYADDLFHFGPLLGIERAHEQARTAFERADQLGTGYPGALLHLAELAFISGDTTALRSAVGRLRARDLSPSLQKQARWMLASAVHDTAELARLWRDSIGHFGIFNLPQQAGIALDEAEKIAQRWRHSSATTQESITALRLQWMLALNRGQPARARVYLDSAATLARSARHLTGMAARLDQDAVRAALYWGGDSVAARGHVMRLEARSAGALPGDTSRHWIWLADRCVLEEWRLEHGMMASVDTTIRALAAAALPGARLCGQALAARAAFARGRSDASLLLDSLDAVARTAPPAWEFWLPHGNLLIARLYELHGRIGDAAAAARRRGVYYQHFNEYLSTYLREHGRLALAHGDTAAAIRSLRHYLALSAAAEPAQRSDRDRFAAMLASLLRDDATGAPPTRDRRSR